MRGLSNAIVRARLDSEDAGRAVSTVLQRLRRWSCYEGQKLVAHSRRMRRQAQDVGVGVGQGLKAEWEELSVSEARWSWSLLWMLGSGAERASWRRAAAVAGAAAACWRRAE
jgi:hypothetical protein